MLFSDCEKQLFSLPILWWFGECFYCGLFPCSPIKHSTTVSRIARPHCEEWGCRIAPIRTGGEICKELIFTKYKYTTFSVLSQYMTHLIIARAVSANCFVFLISIMKNSCFPTVFLKRQNLSTPKRRYNVSCLGIPIASCFFKIARKI